MPRVLPTVVLAVVLVFGLAGSIARSDDGPTGLPQMGGLVDLPSQANVSLAGAIQSGGMGATVAAAGDVNGDGLADAVAGSRTVLDPARDPAAAVLFGTASPEHVDAAVLGDWGYVLRHFPLKQVYSGSSVAPAGDVNGDGLSDIYVTSVGSDADPITPALFVFGKRSTAPLDLTDLSGRGFAVPFPAGDALRHGASVGDVDGDGRPDFALAAARTDFHGRDNAGSVYVLLGQPGISPVDPANLGARGYRIDGAEAGDELFVAAPAGDVNGDGIADMVLGVEGSEFFKYAPGKAYVVFGSRSRANIDLAALGPRGFEIDGIAIHDAAGLAVAGVGDLDGDGLADVGIGVPQLDGAAGAKTGSVFVVRGKTDSTVVRLAEAGAAFLRIDGDTPDGRAGWSVSPAGDFNGDGRPDVLIGAPGAGVGERRYGGSAYVIFGRADPAVISLADLGRLGVRMDGGPGSAAGLSVALAGDFNGDGRADIVIGAPGASVDRRGTGAAYVVYGFGHPALAYPRVVARVGKPFRVLPSRVRRTGAARFSISPALLRGVRIDRRTGEIRGVARHRLRSVFTVAMSDLTGTINATLSLDVRSSPPRKRSSRGTG